MRDKGRKHKEEAMHMLAKQQRMMGKGKEERRGRNEGRQYTRNFTIMLST